MLCVLIFSIIQNQSGHLLDTENNVMNKESLDVTLQDFLSQINEQKTFARTRSQTKLIKSLVFSFKFDECNIQEKTEQSTGYTDFCSTHFGSMNAVPMEWDSQLDDISNPIESNSVDQSSFSTQPSTYSTPKAVKKRTESVFLIFSDRDGKRSDREILVKEDGTLKDASSTLCLLEQLKTHRLHCFDSNGNFHESRLISRQTK